MTKDQYFHIGRIQHEFQSLSQHKYTRGALEHGGNLWDLPAMILIDMAIEEAVDQFIYLTTLRDALREQERKAKGQEGT